MLGLVVQYGAHVVAHRHGGDPERFGELASRSPRVLDLVQRDLALGASLEEDAGVRVLSEVHVLGEEAQHLHLLDTVAGDDELALVLELVEVVAEAFRLRVIRCLRNHSPEST